MQTFDQAIMKFHTEGKVSLETALRYCSNPTEFELRVKGIHATSDESWKSFEHKESPV
jgi:Tfp pilus assembly ATPase PilU